MSVLPAQSEFFLGKAEVGVRGVMRTLPDAVQSLFFDFHGIKLGVA